ncbi:hypothetical protein OMK68_15405 [Rhodococcus pyridinivorans]|uniref:hypothetical protein n=1 Tax=Rhodococcus pyridinivorans TaxID=103816 RepID=UPI0022275BED|nr:hypothetical protein [Rhodococcus pyridinivorans]MCW3471016.1 hypothetical protein [Rhodococcus pyridinivorans]
MSTATEHPTDHRESLAGLQIPARYRHDWTLFTDWCAAADHRPIPAAPETVALFVREHPAATATQRRRLSAINTVHTRHGYPAPGRTEAVRRHLDTTRAERAERLTPILLRTAAELPTSGWPSGLFGRRDAMLLVLAATGMSFTDITRLRRRDITTIGGTLVATTRAGEHFRLTPDPTAEEHPGVEIYQQWAQIQAFLDAYPGTHLLRRHLTDPIEIALRSLTTAQGRQPLLCPIDRWGHLPHTQAMTAQSVSVLVRAHLSGRTPTHPTLPATPPDPDETWVEPEIVLDPSYYERGTAARRRDHQDLENLAETFDELEQQADALLDELLAVLEGL